MKRLQGEGVARTSERQIEIETDRERVWGSGGGETGIQRDGERQTKREREKEREEREKRKREREIHLSNGEPGFNEDLRVMQVLGGLNTIGHQVIVKIG